MNTKTKPEITWVNGLATVHFLDIEDTNHKQDGIEAVSRAYIRAQAKAEKFGGKKVHRKAYGGGIGFPSESKALECVEHFQDEAWPNSQ